MPRTGSVNLVVPDFNVDVNSGFNFEVGNFRNGVRGALDFDNSGVNSHLKGLVGVGT